MSGAGTVLVVDDSRTMRLILHRTLAKGGYAVIEAGGGADALQLQAGASYDVVVTDLQMPVVDGWSVLAGVKSATPDAEVIILSGDSDARLADLARDRGAHAYLPKPFEPEAVLSSVGHAMEKSRARRSAVPSQT